MVRLRRWIRLKLKREPAVAVLQPMTPIELNQAFEACVKESQSQTFSREIELMAKNKPVPLKGPFLSLDPFVCSQGILRVANGTSWRFIPSRAPHFGGLWEAAVRSFKTHLKRTLGPRRLIYEEFCTVLVGIETVLNSRPLGPVTGDPDDLMVLTPGHFLVGGLLMTVSQLETAADRLDSLTHWALARGLQAVFWRKWSREYLNTLQQRSKWKRRKNEIHVSDIAVVVDPSLIDTSGWYSICTLCHIGRCCGTDQIEVALNPSYVEPTIGHQHHGWCATNVSLGPNTVKPAMGTLELTCSVGPRELISARSELAWGLVPAAGLQAVRSSRNTREILHIGHLELRELPRHTRWIHPCLSRVTRAQNCVQRPRNQLIQTASTPSTTAQLVHTYWSQPRWTRSSTPATHRRQLARHCIIARLVGSSSSLRTTPDLGRRVEPEPRFFHLATSNGKLVTRVDVRDSIDDSPDPPLYEVTNFTSLKQLNLTTHPGQLILPKIHPSTNYSTK
ncbi:unnamed protein product [Trichogramma brassicae]|uniref:DUF5641 domain-containing protein n=1 Tax=Trichogramma brassicae TaxID=86971 RepID=A0A6H5IY09_9HYME|nr:unnamed protein product [Trichogramma brassicae]